MRFDKKQKLYGAVLIVIVLSILVICFAMRHQKVNIYKDVDKKQEVTNEETSEIEEVKGVFYKVEKDDKTLYLGGSVHMAKGKYKFTKTIEKAFDEASVLVTELLLSKSINSTSKDADRYYFDNGDKLFNHLSKENVEKVKELIKELSISEDVINNYKPWLAGTIIQAKQAEKLNVNAETGIDMYFYNKAVKANKKFDALETGEFQMDILSGFSYEEQEKYFISCLKSIREVDKNQLSDAVKGDIDALNKRYKEEDKNNSYYKNLILDRNINMADKIDQLIKNNEKYFIVVGVHHVLGDNGLVNLLTQKGYKVERIS